MWVAYCLIVIIPNPENHTWLAIGGLLVGSVFLWGSAWLLLGGVRRWRLPVPAMVVYACILLAIDLAAKALVKHYLAGGTVIWLVPNWLSLRFAPNYSNNVLLNLLGVVGGSSLVHALIKLVSFVLLSALLYSYCRKQKYPMGDNRFRWAVTLMAAGAASSTIESAFRGYIIDFISFSTLVSFDLKDLYLMYGIGLFIVVIAIWEKADRTRKKEATKGNIEKSKGDSTMSKKIMILNGSPRANGNTAALVEAFTKGAQEAGHEVTTFNLQKMGIHPCMGCLKGGKDKASPCMQKDGMEQIYPVYQAADIFVMASPMYYWGVTAQLKAAIDRLFAVTEATGGTPAMACMMLMAAEGNSDDNNAPVVHYYESLLKHLGWQDLGQLYAGGVYEVGDIAGKPALEDAYHMGKGIR